MTSSFSTLHASILSTNHMMPIIILLRNYTGTYFLIFFLTPKFPVRWWYFPSFVGGTFPRFIFQSTHLLLATTESYRHHGAKFHRTGPVQEGNRLCPFHTIVDIPQANSTTVNRRRGRYHCRTCCARLLLFIIIEKDIP